MSYDVITDNDPVKKWEKRIEAEKKIRKSYRNRCVTIDEIYSSKNAPYTNNTGNDQPDSDYNVLWINCEILTGALFAQNPIPDVRRRYKDALNIEPALLQMSQMQPTNEQEQQQVLLASQEISDETERNDRYNKLGKDVSALMERALTFTQDQEDSYGNGASSVLDFVKYGAGQMRVRYVPIVNEGMPKKITVIKGEEGYSLETGEVIDNERLMDIQGGDEEGYFLEEQEDGTLEHEELQPEFVPLSRFHWECVSNWKDVSWCVIDHFLTYDELVDQFGEEKAKKIPLEYTDAGIKADEKKSAEGAEPNRAMIRECFDKRNLKVQIYATSGTKLLEDMDDPYNLQDFYPFPKPMLGTMGDGGVNPIPDYIYYQSQHAELNTITSRINKLLEVIKYRGFYDGSLTDLVELEAMDDGEFKQMTNYAELAASMGGTVDLNKLIASMPIQEALGLLTFLYNAREQVLNVIYEITGISDIIRGSTMASETLGAQQLKSQYANLRLSTRQKEVERFFRDIMRIQAEYLSETFEPETLEGMTGMEVTDEMLEILSSDLLRAYVIDIETDSTVMMDSGKEQRERTEALTSLTTMFQTLAPMVQFGLPPELVGQLILFGLKGFKGARELEDMIQTMMDSQQAQQQQAQEQQEEPADPERDARAGLITEETRALQLDNDAAESGIMAMLEEAGTNASV